MDEIELRMGEDGKTKVRAFFGVVGRVCVKDSMSDLPPDFIHPGEDKEDPGQAGNSKSIEIYRKPVRDWDNLELYKRNRPESAGISWCRRNSAKPDELIQVRLDNLKHPLKKLRNEAECDQRLKIPVCEKFWTYHRSSYEGTLFAM
jgi:hypothetical protein